MPSKLFTIYKKHASETCSKTSTEKTQLKCSCEDACKRCDTAIRINTCD